MAGPSRGRAALRAADRRRREAAVADVEPGRARSSTTCRTATGTRTSGSGRWRAGRRASSRASRRAACSGRPSRATAGRSPSSATSASGPPTPRAAARARWRSRAAARCGARFVEHLELTSGLRELALSPDGKKVAFVVRGEVFAASAKDGGDAARVTDTTAAESDVVWAPDSRRVAYVSDRDGTPHLFLYDFATGAETQLTRGAATDEAPRFSPDGKTLAFVRNQRELRALDLEAKTERLLAEGRFGDALGAEPAALVARRPLAGHHRDRREQLLERPAGARGRRRHAPRQLPGQRQLGEHRLGARRHVPALRHDPAHRDGPARARRSGAADAEVPRGPLPRPVPDPGPEARGALRRRSRSRSPRRSRPPRRRRAPRSGRGGVRRDPAAALARAGRRGRVGAPS